MHVEVLTRYIPHPSILEWPFSGPSVVFQTFLMAFRGPGWCIWGLWVAFRALRWCVWDLLSDLSWALVVSLCSRRLEWRRQWLDAGRPSDARRNYVEDVSTAARKQALVPPLRRSSLMAQAGEVKPKASTDLEASSPPPPHTHTNKTHYGVAVSWAVVDIWPCQIPLSCHRRRLGPVGQYVHSSEDCSKTHTVNNFDEKKSSITK